MSRKTTKKARLEQLERERKRRNLMIRGGAAGVIIVLAGLIIFRIVTNSIEGVLNFGAQAQGHDQDVVIEETSLPPVGGVHDPVWLNCGIYDTPVPLKNAIHSMEHGAVWITYRPDLPSDQVARLTGFVTGQSYLVLSPYPNLASNVVMTAWGVQLELDSANDDRVEKFISVYRNGPQTPEKGAPCSGGTGTPIG